MHFLRSANQESAYTGRQMPEKQHCRIALSGTGRGDALGPVSEIPHETRRARRKEGITISNQNGNTVTIDIVDTPGVTTKIDYQEFIEYGMEKDDAVKRAREATEGVAEAMHWLREDIDGVIYMLDATLDPFTQVNIMLVGIIESRNLPVIIVANKIDLPDASASAIRKAFPQHPVIPVSGLEGNNMEELYEKMLETFRVIPDDTGSSDRPDFCRQARQYDNDGEDTSDS